MHDKPTPEPKDPPKPSKTSKNIAKYFEIQIIDVALDSYSHKQYLKSAMLSWSFIEEYFLPTFIKFIADKQDIPLEASILENANASSLIKYYYLISYDKELYNILREANIKRNRLVHEQFKSGSISAIDSKAQESAKFNLKVAVIAIFGRQSGKIAPPSLTLYSKGWNECRQKMLKNIENLFS